MEKHGKEIMKWDECDLVEVEVKHRSETAKMEGWYKSEEDIRKDVYQDSDFIQCEWMYLTDQLTEVMSEKNPGGNWYAEVRNFGWQSLHGHKAFNAADGRAFLRNILPQTDCTFHIFHHGKNGLAIQNFHHDSPTGNEWYYVAPSKNS